MNIRILELLEGAREAEGLTVIIDVFRAFSTASYVMAQGAQKIIPAGAVEDAFALRENIPGAVLMGERGGKMVPGFDYGNSPAQILGVDFTGKTVIQTTGAGTQGVVNAAGADEIIAGSFPMAEAIIRYIRKRNPDTLSLVAMGTRGRTHSDEDTLFAQYIAARLEGRREPDMESIRRHLRTYASARKFFDPAAFWAPEEDFELCLAADRFPFVLKLEQDSNVVHSCFRRVDVSL